MTSNLIDFKTRKRITEKIPEGSMPTKKQTAELIQKELQANDIIGTAISESALDAALEMAKIIEHAVLMQGTREILVMMKVKGVWTYRWVNINCPAEEFVDAVRPIWDGAVNALKYQEDKDGGN
jgi:hypothetical protein